MDPATTTMMLRDEGSLLVAGSFFLVLGCVLGLVVWRLLSHPPARRAGFRAWGACSRKTSACAGVALAAAVFAAFAATSLRGFHRVDISPRDVLLRYVLPFGDVSLQRVR